MCQQQGRADCESYSLLHLSTLNLPYTVLSNADQEQRNRAVRQYATGNADTALSLMQQIVDDNGGFIRTYQYLLPVAYGVLQYENDLYAESIDSYDFSIEMQYHNPLAYYFRSRAYTRLDNTARAARDACTYQAQADEALQTTFAPLPTACDEPATENWIAYPMVSATFSPGGTKLSDDTLTDAIPVRLAVLDDNVMALSSVTSAEQDTLEYLASAESFDDPEMHRITHVLRSLNVDGYALIRAVQTTPGLCCGEGSALLIVEDGSRYVYESTSHRSEAGTRTWGQLLPADAPDPRAALPERTCEGLPRSRLSTGETVRPVHGMQPAWIYTEPDDTGESEFVSWNHPPYPAPIVQEGPVCTDDSIWWRVTDEDNDVSGWMQEAEGTTYYLLPDGYRIPRRIQDVFTIDEPEQP
jgi:hypothetical protein